MVEEDTVTVSQTMRAASPPASGAEVVESGRRRRGMLGRMAKQNSLDDMGLDLGDVFYFFCHICFFLFFSPLSVLEMFSYPCDVILS